MVSVSRGLSLAAVLVIERCLVLVSRAKWYECVCLRSSETTARRYCSGGHIYAHLCTLYTMVHFARSIYRYSLS